MSLPIAEVEIPHSAVISCAEHGFAKSVRVATVCTACPYFEGLGLMSLAEELPWSHRYAVRCRGLVERRTHEEQEVIG